MRIRIRYRNPPSRSPPPLHTHTRPDLLQPSDSPNQTPDKDPQPSDLTISGVHCSSGSDEMNNTTNPSRRGGSNQDPPVGDGEEEEEEVDAETSPTVVSNPSRCFNKIVKTCSGGSVCRLGHSSETSAGGSSISLSQSSHQGHWCEEDKLFPLKKRKVSFNRKLRARTASDDEQKKGVRETPRSTGKSSVKRYYEPESEEKQEDDAVGQKYEAKKRECGQVAKVPIANSNLLCCRKGGGGWRCNRPTIMGHSMCEYHLSYARARYHARARDLNYYVPKRNWQIGSKNVIDNSKKVYTSLYLEEKDDDDFNDKGFEKRGVVKARSISSLLGQTVKPTLKGMF